MLKKKDKVYYARIIPTVGIYEVCELKIRTVKDNWFVGVDKRDKRAYLFANSEIDNLVFMDRNRALEKVQIAETSKKNISDEKYYEEY